jgi:hypothetical protein
MAYITITFTTIAYIMKTGRITALFTPDKFMTDIDIMHPPRVTASGRRARLHDLTPKKEGLPLTL